MRPRQNGRHFADVIFKCIFLNEDIWNLINISRKFVANGQIKNIPALVQITAWHWPGGKPLSEPMMVILLMHIYITLPQWVKEYVGKKYGNSNHNWEFWKKNDTVIMRLSWTKHHRNNQQNIRPSFPTPVLSYLEFCLQILFWKFKGEFVH